MRASALAALVLLLAGCGATAASSRASAPKAAVYVNMNNHSGSDEFVFSPSKLVIRVGTRVIWRNRSMQPHTVTATGSPPAFDSGTQTLINRGHIWSHVFRKPGTYHYFCLLHPYMKGTIVVRS